MDYVFYLQQGQLLIEKKDAESMRMALSNFIKANEITSETDFGKPKVLFYLAVGNLMIGNIEQSYKIACKAKRMVDVAEENSLINMDNIRQVIGEDDIDDLILHIKENYPQEIFFTNTENDFNENESDFSLVDKLYESRIKEKIITSFSIEKINDDILLAVFSGLSRTNDEFVYFDIVDGNVYSYVQGYFSSLLGDQIISNRLLAGKIMNNSKVDFIDENRHLLINRLTLIDFLSEYKIQANGKEPFSSYVDYFSIEVLKDFTGLDFTLKDLACSNHIQEKFHNIFIEEHQNNMSQLNKEYSQIFELTCKALAFKWIKNNVFVK